MNVDTELVPELQRRNLLMKALPNDHSERGIRKFGQNLFSQDGWGPCVQIPDVDVRALKPSNFDSSVKEGNGTDALAWYCSYHSYPKGKWGIFILDAGIYYLAMRVFGLQATLSAGSPMKSPGNFASIDHSFRVLFFHEYFHFLVDVAASTLEIASKSASRPLYSDYMRMAYMNKIRSVGEPLEEALANAYAYSRVVNNHLSVTERHQLVGFMKNQPKGYRAFARYLGSGFNKGLRNLGASIANSTSRTTGCAPLELLFVTSGDRVSSWDVPVYVVSSVKSRNEPIEMPIQGRSKRDMRIGEIGRKRMRETEELTIRPILEVPLSEPTALGRIQTKIDVIEDEVRKWQYENHDCHTSVFDIAEQLGKRKRYERLLKRRDELMWAEEEH